MLKQSDLTTEELSQLSELKVPRWYRAESARLDSALRMLRDGANDLFDEVCSHYRLSVSERIQLKYFFEKGEGS